MTDPVLELQDVTKRFGSRREPVWALAGVSLTLGRGETLGIVGESGCGKSTLARIAIGLEKPSSGHVSIMGEPPGARRGGVGRGTAPAQMVFQDPASSLDPLLRLLRSVREPLDAATSKGPATARATAVLNEVGLGGDAGGRWPCQISGGQKQRASIARAIAALPPVIICDEAVTALDVSIRAQILNLLRAVQNAHGTAYLFISHDLCTVAYMSDRIMVMYLGKVMELASTEQLLAAAAHPYSFALLGAVPGLQQGTTRRAAPLWLRGDPPSVMNVPPGCRFQTRCPLANDRCRREEPILRHIAPGHLAACHYAPVDPAALAASVPADSEPA